MASGAGQSDHQCRSATAGENFAEHHTAGSAIGYLHQNAGPGTARIDGHGKGTHPALCLVRYDPEAGRLRLIGHHHFAEWTGAAAVVGTRSCPDGHTNSTRSPTTPVHRESVIHW